MATTNKMTNDEMAEYRDKAEFLNWLAGHHNPAKADTVTGRKSILADWMKYRDIERTRILSKIMGRGKYVSTKKLEYTEEGVA